MDYTDFIPEDLIVRAIHDTLELIKGDAFISQYQDNGRSSHHQ